MIKRIKLILDLLVSLIYGGKKVKIFLKSGNILTFRCKTIKIEGKNNKISSCDIYDFNNELIWFSIDQIEAITVSY